MSLSSASTSTNWSTYCHLFRIAHPDEPIEHKQESLRLLPSCVQTNLLSHIATLAGHLVEKEAAFNDSARVLKAVERVAQTIFEQTDPRDQSRIAQHLNTLGQRDLRTFLHSMDSALGDWTPDLQRQLDKWASEAKEIHGHEEDRDEVNSLLHYFLRNRREDELYFNNIRLRELPPVLFQPPFTTRLKKLTFESCKIGSVLENIHCFSNLTTLDLTDVANIYKFPKAMFHLQKLKDLTISGCNILAHPEKLARIDQFQALEYLTLSGCTWKNLLKQIPNALCNLTNLKKLALDGYLESLPSDIHRLTNLRQLDLSYCDLDSVPSDVFNLPELRHLNLTYNSLHSLPEIDQRERRLETLRLTDNDSLQSLPESMSYLPSSCCIDLDGTSLERSPDLRSNFLERWNAPGRQTPRVFFSSRAMSQYLEDGKSGRLRPLPDLIAELFRILNQPPQALPELDKLEESEKNSLRSWLSRLSDAADFQRENHLKIQLIEHIVHYLKLANDNPTFREVFLPTIKFETNTCGDQIALSVLRVGVAYRLQQIKEIDHLAKFLLGTVWPLELLEKVAEQKVQDLKQIYPDKRIDPIEVYLIYPVKLREALGLEIDIQHMLFSVHSRVTQEELNAAEDLVKDLTKGEEAKCSFLTQREDWKAALRSKFPERCQFEQEAHDKLERGEEISAEFLDQGWRKLTKEILFPAAPMPPPAKRRRLEE